MTTDRKFTISECFYYEDITRRFTLYHKRELNIYELIKLGIENDNYNYIDYLIFKRLHLIEDLIKKETQNTEFKLDLTQYEDMENTDIDELTFENLLNYYAKTHNNNESNEINIEDLIKTVVYFKHWYMLYYIYFKERDDLHLYKVKEDEKYCEYQRELQRNRKFYIIRM